MWGSCASTRHPNRHPYTGGRVARRALVELFPSARCDLKDSALRGTASTAHSQARRPPRRRPRPTCRRAPAEGNAGVASLLRGGGSLAERSAFWATCSCVWRDKSSRARAPSSSPHAPRRRRPRAETRELVRRREEQGPFEPVGRLTARLPAPFSSLTATTGRLVGPRGWRPTPRCSRRRAPPLRCARRLALLGRTAPLGR